MRLIIRPRGVCAMLGSQDGRMAGGHSGRKTMESAKVAQTFYSPIHTRLRDTYTGTSSQHLSQHPTFRQRPFDSWGTLGPRFCFAEACFITFWLSLRQICAKLLKSVGRVAVLLLAPANCARHTLRLPCIIFGLIWFLPLKLTSTAGESKLCPLAEQQFIDRLQYLFRFVGQLFFPVLAWPGLAWPYLATNLYDFISVRVRWESIKVQWQRGGETFIRNAKSVFAQVSTY